MAALITEDELTAALPSLATRADLDLLIGAASAAIEKHCDRTFGYNEAIAERLSGNNTSDLYLSRTPVAAVTAVQINGVDLDNTNGDAWTFDPESGRLIRGEGRYDPRFAPWWAKGLRNVLVTYNGGYVEIPDDVKSAAIALIKWFLDTYRVTGIVQSEKLGDYQYSAAIGAAFPPSVAAILSPYRRNWIS